MSNSPTLRERALAALRASQNDQMDAGARDQAGNRIAAAFRLAEALVYADIIATTDDLGDLCGPSSSVFFPVGLGDDAATVTVEGITFGLRCRSEEDSKFPIERLFVLVIGQATPASPGGHAETGFRQEWRYGPVESLAELGKALTDIEAFGRQEGSEVAP